MNAPSRPPLRSSDLMASLAEIEHRFPVQTWTVDDIAMWPVLRVRWFFAEWAAHYTAQASTPGSAMVSRLKTLALDPILALRAQWRDRSARPRHVARTDLLFVSDGVSFSRLGDLWYERFCDPLIAAAAQRGLTCAMWTPSHAYLTPRATPSRWIQPALDRANVAGALAARGAAEPAWPGHQDALRWLTERGLGPAPMASRKALSDARRIQAISRWHERQLAQLSPRMAFVVNYYGIEGMAFVLACRRAGVPVVDLQHGVQGSMHPAYAAWPATREGVHALLPDRFWVWSAWERDVIARWSHGSRHRAVVGGNPWQSVWQPGSHWPGVAEAAESARELRSRAADRPVVLVTLQFGLDAAEQLLPLKALLLEAAGRLAFWIRLHPAMLERREEVRRLLGFPASPHELDLATDLPLQALLPHANLHLTHSSSTVIEAAQFGVPSVITTDYGAELFAPLIDSGAARVETGDSHAVIAALDAAGGTGRSTQAAPPSIGAVLDELLGDCALR